MSNSRITIELEGLPDDDGKLRLSSLIGSLGVIVASLHENEKRISGGSKSKVDYKIISLKQDSPAIITLEPIAKDDLEQVNVGEAILDSFLTDLTFIKEQKTIPSKLSYDSVERYFDIGTLTKRNITSLTIRNGQRSIQIDDTFRTSIKSAIGPDTTEAGAVCGRLESVNAHNGNLFFIYPEIGPAKVRCVFVKELKEKVKDALYRRVEVSGTLKYKSWDNFPYAINVNAISIIPEDEELAGFADLIGADRDATGGLTSIEFLQKIRNEDE